MGKKKRYKNIYVKMIIIYLIINGTLLMGVLEVNKHAQKELKEQYIQFITAGFEIQAKNLETDLLYAKSIQDIIINDSRVKWLIYQAPIESIYNVYRVGKEVQDLLTALEITNPIIGDIGIYMEPMKTIVSYKEGFTRGIEPFNISTINQKKFIQIHNKELYLIKLPMSINEEYKYFCYIRINDKAIKESIKNMQNILEGIEVAIFQGDVILYQTEFFEPPKERENHKREQYFLFDTNIVSSDIKMVMYLDAKNIVQPITKSSQAFKLWIVISTGAMAVFLIYTYYMINKPFKKLMRLMNDIEKNNWNVDITYNSNDQFQYIFEGFRRMIESLKSYIAKTYEQGLEINRSELRQLQAQINPHFLYNCFFNISKMCKIEDSENAMILSQKLAKYYMFITRNGEDYVKLEEEYMHTKLYLDIQAIRFGDRVDIQIDEIPDEFKNMQVPRIILQPLVENCYKYVFERIGEDGKISIEIGGKQDQYLEISVQDNGYLIKNEEIEILNNSLIKDEKEKETTGLFNVNRRLKLKFGPESGIRVERGELGGLKVQVLIVMGE